MPLCQSELRQKPGVVFGKETDVGNAVLNHRQAFDAETECPASVGVIRIADCLEHVRIHHAAAGNLNPFLAASAEVWRAQVNLETWFGVREKMWAEPDLRGRVE